MNCIPHIEQIKKINRLPKRAILFNEEKGFDEIKKIIGYISNIWGGFQTIIIPYSNGEVNYNFIKILKEYDTDYIYFWKEEIPETIKNFLLNNSFPFELKLIRNNKRFPYPECEVEGIFSQLIGSGIKILNLCDDVINQKYYSLVALTGYYPKESYPYFDVRSVKDEFYKNDKLINMNRYTRIENGEYYPFDISLYGVDIYSPNYEELDLHLISGSSLQDYCLYFNMCRLKKNVLWIYDNKYRKNIDCLINKSVVHGEKIIVYDINDSGFCNENRYLEKYRENELVLLKEIREENLNSDYEIAGTDLNCSESIWFKDNITVDKVKPDCLSGFEDEQSEKCRFLTEIRIDNYKAINKKINIDIDDCRISKNGITFKPFRKFIYIGGESGKIKNNLKGSMIKKYSLLDTIKGIMQKKEYTIKISNQGKYTKNILSKFNNNLAELAELLVNEENKKIFDLYINSSKNIGILINKRKYFTRCDFEQVIRNKNNLDNIMEYLISCNILEIGYLIKCPHCSCTRWISLDDIRKDFKCIQCNNDIKYSYNISRFNRDIFEPQIYYKLDEIFYLALKQDFDVPILTLYHYKKNSKKYFEYITEIDVFSKQSKYCEIDFICNSDGKLLIGECKKNNQIETKQIDSYIHLVHNLGFDKLIFATMKEKWKEKINNYLFTKNDKLIKVVGAEIMCLDVKNEKNIKLVGDKKTDIYEIKLRNKKLKDVFVNYCKINTLSKEGNFNIEVNLNNKYINSILEYVNENLGETLKRKIPKDLDAYFVTEDANVFLDSDNKILMYFNYAMRSIEFFKILTNEKSKCQDIIESNKLILKIVM